jgi:catechol 2,3-dioxygenase-like lactoylglutathione lyase family enzyme
VAFFGDVLGLRLELERLGFWMLKLPDGSKVEVFGPDSPINRHFTTGPVAGFLVDDVHAAADELRAAGVEILLEPGSTTAATPGCTSAPRTATSTS